MLAELKIFIKELNWVFCNTSRVVSNNIFLLEVLSLSIILIGTDVSLECVNSCLSKYGSSCFNIVYCIDFLNMLRLHHWCARDLPMTSASSIHQQVVNELSSSLKLNYDSN